ncbi:MAG: hypothetical protein RLZZ15_251 [Verrucomicrobiota bacterium]|jgi:uncharacterized protein YndB with AHSA1/START domain
MKWLLLILGALAALVAVMAIIGALLPRDHTATRAAQFRQTPAALFAVVRDFAALPAWRSDLTSVELLPARDGAACYREVSKHGAVTYRVREERAGERLVLEIADENLPYGGRWTFEFRAAPGGGAQMRITEQGFVKNVIFRFLARFVFGYTATMESYLRDLAKKFGEPAPQFSK